MDPLTILSLGSGAAGLLGGLFGGGNGAQEDYMNKLNLMYKSMPNNYDSMIQKYYGMAGSNLQGQQDRNVRAAGNQGFAQSSAMNLSNPYSMMQRYVNNAYGQFAPEFGKLAAGQAGAMYQGSQDAMSNKLRLMQMMGQAAQGSDQSGFNFGRDMGPGLMSLGGSLGSALIGRK